MSKSYHCYSLEDRIIKPLREFQLSFHEVGLAEFFPHQQNLWNCAKLNDSDNLSGFATLQVQKS